MSIQTEITKRFIETTRETLADAKAKDAKHVRLAVADLAILIELADPTATKVDAMVSGLIERVLALVEGHESELLTTEAAE